MSYLDLLTNEEKIHEAYEMEYIIDNLKHELFVTQLKLKIAQAPNGGTVYIDKYKIHDIKPDETIRYGVSTTNNDTQDKVNEFLKTIDESFKGFIGWWKDSNGVIYIDNTNIYPSRYLHLALKIAREHRQQAIYDLFKEKEISVKEV